MIRLFVGLDFPPDVRQILASSLSGIPNARWVPAENLHLTLRFIGEVDEDVADDIHDQLATLRHAPFSLNIRGCGAFAGGHRAQTLWAGVELSPALEQLQEKVDRAVMRAGMPSEGRKYTPHITLARLKDGQTGRVQDYIAGNNLLRITCPVDRFILFSSHLGRNDPQYRAEVTYPLEG